MLIGYNDCEFLIPARGAVSVTVKRRDCPPVTVSEKKGDFFSVDTTGWQAGTYYFQLTMQDGRVTPVDLFEIRQNLATAPDGYDPKSQAQITLEAIDAMLANRATAQQRRIQLGDKSIDYSSLDELLKWRAHFQKIVRAEQGKAQTARRQLFDMRRN